MLKREPYIDLVIGPQAYHKINEKIQEYFSKHKKMRKQNLILSPNLII